MRVSRYLPHLGNYSIGVLRGYQEVKHHILKTFKLGPGDEGFPLDASVELPVDVVGELKCKRASLSSH